MSAVIVTKENFKEVIGEKKLALVEFYAPWCTYCRRIAPAFEKLTEQYSDKLAIGRIDIDSSPELAETYQVEVVPTFVVFENGSPVKDLVAPESKAQLESLIRQYL